MKLVKRLTDSRFAIVMWEKKWFVILGLAGISILFLSSGLYVMYTRYQTLLTQVTNPSELSDKEAEDLLSKVGQLMSLPTGEKPTIATISDTEKLGDQPFFNQAKIGDKVLIFNAAKKVILYRPQAHKIVNVAPLGVAQVAGTSTTSISPPTAEKVIVAFYNGTEIPKLALKASQKLQAQVSQAVIGEQANAASSDYTTTKIVNLTGISDTVLTQISTVFSAEEIALPSDEKAPEGADVLIIVGTDAEENT